MLRTPTITEYEKELIDDFLSDIWDNKWHFYWPKFFADNYADKLSKSPLQNYNLNKPCEDYLYNLFAHKSNVIELRTLPDQGKNTRWTITAKGTEVYQLGGYNAWEKFNNNRNKYISKNFTSPYHSLVSSVWIGSIALLLSVISLFQSCNENERDKYVYELLIQRSKDLEQIRLLLFEKEKNQTTNSQQDSVIP